MRCPPPGQLEQFLNGHLTGAAAEAVAAHVDSCRSCQTALESFTGDAGQLATPLKQPMTEDLSPSLARLAQMAGYVDDLFESVHAGGEPHAAVVPLPEVKGYELLG